MHPIHRRKHFYLNRGLDFFICTEENNHWYTLRRIGKSLFNVFIDDERVPLFTVVLNRKGLNIYHANEDHYKHVGYDDIEFLDLPLMQYKYESIEGESNFDGVHDHYVNFADDFHLDPKHY